MKFQMTCFATLAALVSAAPVLAVPSTASADTVQATVARVFVPSVGYDDNDNVTIRVEGTLPDACYVIGDRKISRHGNTFTIHQRAWSRKSGTCGTGDLLPEVTYSADVALGQLAAGEYRVKQKSESGAISYVSFMVSPAKSTSVDDYRYADVTQISVDDVVQPGQDAVVTIRGLYSSSCAELAQPISVELIGNVYVIRPIEMNAPGVSCDEMILRLFTQTVHLASPPAGEYLVHVRASAGRVVEQTFTVLRPQDPAISLN